MTTMEPEPTDGTRSEASVRFVRELRHRNPRALALDGLYLFMTAFFTFLATQGLWPAVIAAIPLAGLLFFGWKSSRPFFLGQLLAAIATVAFVLSDIAVL